LPKKTLEILGNFKIEGQVIINVKYAADLDSPGLGNIMLQGMIGRQNEIGRCYGLEMKGKNLRL
jgi:hypothetical protein